MSTLFFLSVRPLTHHENWMRREPYFHFFPSGQSMQIHFSCSPKSLSPRNKVNYGFFYIDFLIHGVLYLYWHPHKVKSVGWAGTCRWGHWEKHYRTYPVVCFKQKVNREARKFFQCVNQTSSSHWIESAPFLYSASRSLIYGWDWQLEAINHLPEEAQTEINVWNHNMSRLQLHTYALTCMLWRSEV